MRATIFLLLALAFTACSSVQAPIKIRSTAGASKLVGTWHVEGSTALFTIRSQPRYSIEGWDRQGGERFRISGMYWDGRQLSGTFTMPSTAHTTYSALSFATPNRLVGQYRGDTTNRAEVWNRSK